MAHGTEREILDHIQHRFDHFATQNLPQHLGVFYAAPSPQRFEKHLQLFDCPDPRDPEFPDLPAALVGVLLFPLVERRVCLL